MRGQLPCILIMHVVYDDCVGMLCGFCMRCEELCICSDTWWANTLSNITASCWRSLLMCLDAMHHTARLFGFQLNRRRNCINDDAG